MERVWGEYAESMEIVWGEYGTGVEGRKQNKRSPAAPATVDRLCLCVVMCVRERKRDFISMIEMHRGHAQMQTVPIES